MFRRSRRTEDVIGLAFSGGGSRGASQLGALKALLESGIEPQLVAGTSAGAVNAAWYALHPDRIEDQELLWRRLRMSDVFPGNRVTVLYNLTRRGYVHEPSAWERMLWREFGRARFEDLQIPCAVSAVNLSTGRRAVLDSGLIVPALMASTAIPGVFPPYRLGSDIYVDGGVLEYLPLDNLFERGATEVFAFDCSSYQMGLDFVDSVADRCGRIAARDAALRTVTLATSQGRHVHLLQPDLPEFADARDFSHTDELIRAGYDHAASYLQRLPRLFERQSAIRSHAG
jgi:NTE family protein